MIFFELLKEIESTILTGLNSSFSFVLKKRISENKVVSVSMYCVSLRTFTSFIFNCVFDYNLSYDNNYHFIGLDAKDPKNYGRLFKLEK